MRKILILATIFAIALCAEQISTENNAAKSLLEYLDKMTSQITTEQIEHESLKTQQEAQCDEELSFRSKEVSDAQAAIKNAQVSLDRCNTAVATTNANLAQVDLNIRNINKILDDLKITRDEERAHYQNLIDNQLRPALNDVLGVYGIIQELQDEAASFDTLTRHASALFQHMIKAKKVEQVAPLLTALVTLGTSDANISRELTDRIRKLFNDLEVDLNAAIDKATTTENQRQDLYNNTVLEYNNVLTKQAEYKSNLSAYLAIVQACVDRETSVFSDAVQKEIRNQVALDSAANMCYAFQNEYKNATQARLDEQDLLSKIKAFIKEQSDAFGEYGQEEDNGNFHKDFENSRNKQVGLIQEFINSRLEKSKQHNSFIQKSAPSKCKSCKKGFVQKKLSQ